MCHILKIIWVFRGILFLTYFEKWLHRNYSYPVKIVFMCRICCFIVIKIIEAGNKLSFMSFPSYRREGGIKLPLSLNSHFLSFHFLKNKRKSALFSPQRYVIAKLSYVHLLRTMQRHKHSDQKHILRIPCFISMLIFSLELLLLKYIKGQYLLLMIEIWVHGFWEIGNLLIYLQVCII